MQTVPINQLQPQQTFKLSAFQKMYYKLVEYIRATNEYKCKRTDADYITIYLQPGTQVVIPQDHET